MWGEGHTFRLCGWLDVWGPGFSLQVGELAGVRKKRCDWGHARYKEGIGRLGGVVWCLNTHKSRDWTEVGRIVCHCSRRPRWRRNSRWSCPSACWNPGVYWRVTCNHFHHSTTRHLPNGVKFKQVNAEANACRHEHALCSPSTHLPRVTATSSHLRTQSRHASSSRAQRRPSKLHLCGAVAPV